MKNILSIYCTNNRPDDKILYSTIESAIAAKKASTLANVNIAICAYDTDFFSWHIDNAKLIKSAFKGLGHLNYLNQIAQAIAVSEPSDIICILEHDVLYPADYFDRIVSEWDYNKYGVIDLNYIGMNQNGYVAVKERHEPFSVFSFASFYLVQMLGKKIIECYKNSTPENPFGWTCVEPDNKEHFKMLPYTGYRPIVHINTNNTVFAHHFTTHADVCYETEAFTQEHEYWGDFKKYFPEKDFIQNAFSAAALSLVDVQGAEAESEPEQEPAKAKRGRPKRV